jgi:hypothetical protein
MVDPSVPSPTHSQDSDTAEREMKELYTHNVISPSGSSHTLEHRRQVVAENKIIYSVRFEPDESRYLAIGALLRDF